MGMIQILERGGNDVRKFEDSLKMAKEGVMMACELFEEMKDQFSERGNYGERYSQRGDYGERYSQRGGYYGRDYDEMSERRYRDTMGRYR